jgi:hypothetical protein
MRLNKLSISNLQVADEIRIESNAEKFMVRLVRCGNAAYLHTGSDIMLYPSIEHARRAIRRIRPDLEPTTI